MAPKSDIDASAYDVFAPVRNLKVVDKTSTLPVVNTVLSEVASLTSPVLPYVDQSVATLKPLINVAKSKVEETVVPRLPEGTREAVKSKLDIAMSTLTEAVDKVDTYACGGVDQLLEKMPALKEQTPTLVQATKDAIVTQTDNLMLYISSFSLVLFALKFVDSGLSILEQTIECARVPDDNKVALGIRMVHGYANTKRVQGTIKSGSEKARRIESASVLGAFLEVLGLGSLLGAESKTNEEENVKFMDDGDDSNEKSLPVAVDTDAEHVEVTDKVDNLVVVKEEAEQVVVVKEEAEQVVVVKEEAEQVPVVDQEADVDNTRVQATEEVVTEVSDPVVTEEAEQVRVVDDKAELANSDTEEDPVVLNEEDEQVPVIDDEEANGADSD